MLELKVIGFAVLNMCFHAMLFSSIFWLLTWVAKSLYSNKYYNYKLNFYECGFKSLTTVNINYQINFILVLLFIIIYDGEFLVIIPISLNLSLISISSFLLLSFFLMWLLFSLSIDYVFNTLDWQV